MLSHIHFECSFNVAYVTAGASKSRKWIVDRFRSAAVDKTKRIRVVINALYMQTNNLNLFWEYLSKYDPTII